MMTTDAHDCQTWKETADHWKKQNAEEFSQRMRLVEENARLRAENERLKNALTNALKVLNENNLIITDEGE